MTLHVYNDLIQGTDEWLEARRGIVTASTVGQLITPSTIRPASNDVSRALTASLVAERITGWSDPVYVNADMMRGTLEEPIARNAYSRHCTTEIVTEAGFMVLEEDGWKLGYSPDGLVGGDGLIEIKSRRQKKHLQTILADTVPPENMAQIQAGLLVSGRDWCDYVSFCGGMPLYRKRVEPDQRWFDAIVAAVQAFETTAAVMVETYEAAVAGLPPTERIDHELGLVF